MRVGLEFDSSLREGWWGRSHGPRGFGEDEVGLLIGAWRRRVLGFWEEEERRRGWDVAVSLGMSQGGEKGRGGRKCRAPGRSV